MQKNISLSKLLFGILIIFSITVRFYKFDNPIADWHSWRQADTSSVSRNLLINKFDLLHPRFDDISNVPSGMDNPEGYRFVEFPIYNLFQAGLFMLIGIFTIEEWGRLVSIFSSSMSLIFIYYLVKKYINDRAGLFAGFFFAFIPFNIYYSRAVLPDPSMVMTTLGGIFFFDRWLENNQKISIFNINFLFSIIFITFALLLKPYSVFFLLPMIYLAFVRFKFMMMLKWQFWLFIILTLMPIIFWRIWMLQYPEGIPSNMWLFNAGNIRFKGSFFYWIFAERIGKLILGYWGVSLLILGIIRRIEGNKSNFFHMFIVSSLLYLIVLARGNVQHDYYQILIIPTICIFLGIGSDLLLSLQNIYFYRRIGIFIFIIVSSFMLSFGWYYIRDFFSINNNSIVIAGNVVDKMIPKNAKVLAEYKGDTTFLYLTKRKGWASFEKPLPEMIKMGADYFILPNPSIKDFDIGKIYPIISSSKDYIIFKLKK